MTFEVRLFADDGTVVEQRFTLERDDAGRSRVVYHPQVTTENGEAVPVEYRFLDGEVTYRATPPLKPSQNADRGSDVLAVAGVLPHDDAPRKVLLMLADPHVIGPDCEAGPAPADAAALADSLRSNPDLEATAPVPVTIGGTPALQMDVSLVPGLRCSLFFPHVPWGVGHRARLSLLDLPEGSEAKVLALVTITDEDSFKPVVAAAAPIEHSIEIHAP